MSPTIRCTNIAAMMSDVVEVVVALRVRGAMAKTMDMMAGKGEGITMVG